MEMPIQIIVVLFVVLIVGGAILAFSKSSLNNAQANLNDRFKNDPASKDIVVQLQTVDASTLLSLADSCVKKNAGQTFQKKICFAVFGDFSQIDWGNNVHSHIVDGAIVDASEFVAGGSPKAVLLTYIPPVGQDDGGGVTITSS